MCTRNVLGLCTRNILGVSTPQLFEISQAGQRASYCTFKFILTPYNGAESCFPLPERDRAGVRRLRSVLWGGGCRFGSEYRDCADLNPHLRTVRAQAFMQIYAERGID